MPVHDRPSRMISRVRVRARTVVCRAVQSAGVEDLGDLSQEEGPTRGCRISKSSTQMELRPLATPHGDENLFNVVSADVVRTCSAADHPA